MKFLTANDTIIACSTGTLSHSAIAVVRLSGFKSLGEFSEILPKLAGPIEPRRVYFDKLYSENEVIDEVCFTYFESPKSYNGENILELSLHGNLLNVERVIQLFVTKKKVRLADPGEFTYRALKNKKMTLSQVEGLDLFIHANSNYALSQGYSLLSGALKEQFLSLYGQYLRLKSALELKIDFSDDVGEEESQKLVLEAFHALKSNVSFLYDRTKTQTGSIAEPEIVLFGVPNAGKSTLFNKLIGSQRAIVSKVAGTTRDYIHELIHVNGVNYRLVDTAGIRESSDDIESEGIKRSVNKIEDSFFKVLLINPTDRESDYSTILKFQYDLIIYTHDDLPSFESSLQKFISDFGSIGPDFVHASRAKEKVFTGVTDKFTQQIKDKPLLLSRHRQVISDTYAVINRLEPLIKSESDVGIISYELNEVGDCLSGLIGIVSADQVLDSIFSNFCIGK